jgi:glycosyltransferase involved in cell wall biosynthesis
VKVCLLSDAGCVSLYNEAKKIEAELRNRGAEVKYERWFAPRTIYDKYDITLWVFPLLGYYFSHMFIANRMDNLGKQYIYGALEGTHSRLRPCVEEMNKNIIITPSSFSKVVAEGHGLRVDAVIPHQVPQHLEVDHLYGKAWRETLPKGKKVLIYNGTPVLRKGLDKLRKAIDILSAKRNDFVMVFHTDDIPNVYHTPLKALEGPNTIVEHKFGDLSLGQVYGKMYYSDIIVMPSRCEGFGLPVAEALALGKPLVCINAPGVNEIANQNNSWMVTRVWPEPQVWGDWITFWSVGYDPKDLAEQIELCLDAKKEEVEEKRAKGLEAVRPFHDSYKRLLKFMGI